MARIRSPNYPAFSLPEAITRIRTIHNAEQHLAAPKEVIAKHLGYNGLNGASLKAISALTKYGLLDEAPGEKLKVSPSAMSILYPKKDEDRGAAIRAAAFKPALFEEIRAEWQGEQPSDENLRSYLIHRQFAADALDRVIQAYRETVDLVTRESGDYTPNHATDEREGQESQDMRQASAAGARTPLGGAAGSSTPDHSKSPFQVTMMTDRVVVQGTLKSRNSIQNAIRALEMAKNFLPPDDSPSPSESEKE